MNKSGLEAYLKLSSSPFWWKMVSSQRFCVLVTRVCNVWMSKRLDGWIMLRSVKPPVTCNKVDNHHCSLQNNCVQRRCATRSVWLNSNFHVLENQLRNTYVFGLTMRRVWSQNVLNAHMHKQASILFNSISKAVFVSERARHLLSLHVSKEIFFHNFRLCIQQVVRKNNFTKYLICLSLWCTSKWYILCITEIFWIPPPGRGSGRHSAGA